MCFSIVSEITWSGETVVEIAMNTQSSVNQLKFQQPRAHSIIKTRTFKTWKPDVDSNIPPPFHPKPTLRVLSGISDYAYKLPTPCIFTHSSNRKDLLQTSFREFLPPPFPFRRPKFHDHTSSVDVIRDEKAPSACTRTSSRGIP